MPNLFDHQTHNEPEVARDKPIFITTEDGEERTAGFVGRYISEGKPHVAYVSRRRREGPQKHFFDKGDGYPIAVQGLLEAAAYDVTEVLIVETDTEDVYEFDFTDYQNGETVKEEGFEEQRCVPLDNYRRMWEGVTDGVLL